jgi:hypothetical protein
MVYPWINSLPFMTSTSDPSDQTRRPGLFHLDSPRHLGDHGNVHVFLHRHVEDLILAAGSIQ